MVSEVSGQLKGAQAVIVAEYRGLNVELVTQLRTKARKSGLYLRVLKNTLARRAVQGTPFEKLTEQMSGPLMYGIAKDPVAGAKVMSEFAKDNELFVIKAGAMPNAVMSAKDVKALALLPSREELLAKLMGTMQAPVAKLVRTMNEVPARFARTLAAVRDAKSGT
jgi:large subunit ribosomal protein L10